MLDALTASLVPAAVGVDAGAAACGGEVTPLDVGAGGCGAAAVGCGVSDTS